MQSQVVLGFEITKNYSQEKTKICFIKYGIAPYLKEKLTYGMVFAISHFGLSLMKLLIHRLESNLMLTYYNGLKVIKRLVILSLNLCL